MREQLIEPKDYTPEIQAKIELIKNRMSNTLIDFTDKDIVVFRYADQVCILANPILGEEPIFDIYDNFQKMIPTRNITIIQDENWLNTETLDNELKFTIKMRLRILRPDLCERVLA